MRSVLLLSYLHLDPSAYPAVCGIQHEANLIYFLIQLIYNNAHLNKLTQHIDGIQ